MSAPKKTDVDEAIEEAVATTQPELFVIPRSLLEATVTSLANYPYKDVGNLVNALRSLKPLGADRSSLNG